MSNDNDGIKRGLRRRNVMRLAALAGGAGLFGSTLGGTAVAQSSSTDLQTRVSNAVIRRESTAQDLINNLTLHQHDSNNDRHSGGVPGAAYVYTKGLGNQTTHNFLEYDDLDTLESIVTNGGNWANLTLEGERQQVSPNSSHTFLTEGMDPWLGTMPSAPSATSDTMAMEMMDNYWMAHHRDVSFEDYGNSMLDSGDFYSDYVYYLQNDWFIGSNFWSNVYRGPFHATDGPYLSQFLLHDVDFGALKLEPKIDPVPEGASTEQDFGTTESEWLDLIEGTVLGVEPGPQTSTTSSTSRQYISNGRNLARYVQTDPSFYHYLAAALWLLPHVESNNDDIEFDNGLPYGNDDTVFPYIDHGGAALLDMVSRATRNALVAAWHQKWRVHLRLRPETMAGRIHDYLTGSWDPYYSYWEPSDMIGNSNITSIIYNSSGNYYLPLAYPEGAPTHPSYPSGHSTIAGAGITVLKTFFEDGNLPGTLYKSQAGGNRAEYTGGNLSVYDELDKLASNIGLGRIFAGVHYISDHYYGAKLGEQIALATMIDVFDDTEGSATPEFRPLDKSSSEPVNVSTLEMLRSENTSKNPDITI